MTQSKTLSVLLLSAGYGTRLWPYTKEWPKCLMPVRGKALLQYWLEVAGALGSIDVVVNLHHQAEIVSKFLKRPVFEPWVKSIFEERLLGTAGTLRVNKQAFRGETILLAHADNYCECDFTKFLQFHWFSRPKDCPMTMMTFETSDPTTCGIVQLDRRGVVTALFEKSKSPPGTLANGAVYLIEREVLDWLCQRPEVVDFSTQVLPHFVGRIATWFNQNTHIDIGSVKTLYQAQLISSTKGVTRLEELDEWSREFASHPIHKQIQFGMKAKRYT
jgi:mannose-1-phosphate guanylyltransferase